MADPKTGRVVSQDDWKRTQVRMPQEQYDQIVQYAESKNLSLNSAMLELMDVGLVSADKTFEMLDSKDLLDTVMTLQDMLRDQKNLAASQYNHLLEQFELLKKTK